MVVLANFGSPQKSGALWVVLCSLGDICLALGDLGEARMSFRSPRVSLEIVTGFISPARASLYIYIYIHVNHTYTCMYIYM